MRWCDAFSRNAQPNLTIDTAVIVRRANVSQSVDSLVHFSKCAAVFEKSLISLLANLVDPRQNHHADDGLQ